MRSAVKMSAALLAALCLLLAAGGCGGDDRSPAPAEVVWPAAEAGETAAQSVSGAGEEALTAQSVSGSGEEALAAAESIRDLFESAYDPGTIHLGLPEELLARIGERLAGTEHAAVDAARQGSAVNGTLLSDFVRRAENGEETALVIYEVCSDGGFIRHALSQSGPGLWVTRTRLAWKGTEPFIGYEESCAVTAVSCEAGLFRYEYFMPDNPPGSNHDGYIDTVVEIPLM